MVRYFFTIILICPLLFFSQSITRSSIASAGTSSNPSIGMTMTFGQPYSNYFSNSNLKIYQGFQQFLLRNESSILNNEIGTEVNVYPNPFASHIDIVCESSDKLKEIRLLNMLGRELYFNKDYIGRVVRIHFENLELPLGNYILSLDFHSGRRQSLLVVKTF